jgi:hypothetical protein
MMGNGVKKIVMWAVSMVPYVLAALFAWAVVGKLSNIGNVVAEVQGIWFIPRGVRYFVPFTVPVAETMLVCLLIHRRTRRFGMCMSIATLGLFAGYLYWRIASGIDAPCHCFGGPLPGNLQKLQTNQAGIARNVFLAIWCIVWIEVDVFTNKRKEVHREFANEARSAVSPSGENNAVSVRSGIHTG